MSGEFTPQQSALLALVPTDGSTIGNTSLRERLGWDDATYASVRDDLVGAGVLEKGKGRGGSVRRQDHVAPKTELFAPGEVESVIPELERARRAAASQTLDSKPKSEKAAPITEHRHTEATRKNIPAAGDALGHVEEEAEITYAYDPHRSPVLRFNEAIVRQRALLQESRRRPLTEAESSELAALLESPQPWLEWAGKREQPDFSVEPVALHIHERVSAQAILRAVRREDIQRDLFADPIQSVREAHAYYQHDVAWANRIITGDSLQVMTSLARREGLAGQVQMIYLDPPYGIKFSSNWQNEVGKRDVKDRDEDLTREPEMIRAYRDTWTLGVHSYLSYLKQRLIVASELLKDSGSIFVQISDENLHRVRAVMDEVLGSENFCRQIIFLKTTGKGGAVLDNTYDALLWYAKDLASLKYHPTYEVRSPAEDSNLRFVELLSGETRQMTDEEIRSSAALPKGARPYRPNPLTNQRVAQGSDLREYWYRGARFTPGTGTFRTDENGLNRLASANRLLPVAKTLTSVRYLDDFPCRATKRRVG